MANAGKVTERSVSFHQLDLRAALDALLKDAAQEGNDVLYARAERMLCELDSAEASARRQTHDLFVSIVFKEHTPS